jgi:hypothetical protein
LIDSKNMSVFSKPYMGAKIYKHNINGRSILKLYNSDSNAPECIIPDYTETHDLFLGKPGPYYAEAYKRKIRSFLTSEGYERWDIQNINGSNTIDIFDYDEDMMGPLNDYLYRENINLNHQFRGCPVCQEDIIAPESDDDDDEGDDLIVCANDTENEHATCCTGRIHERCIDDYLLQHPNVSRDIDSDDWVCADCV